MVGFLCLSSPPPRTRTRDRGGRQVEEEKEEEEEEDFKIHLDFDPVEEWLVDPDHPQMLSMESSDPTEIDSAHHPDPDPPQQETQTQTHPHQEKEKEKELLSSGSPITEKMERVTLVEDDGGGEKTTESNDLTGPEKNDPTNFENEDNIDDDEEEEEEESSEDSSSEESQESSSDESSSSSSSSDDDDDNKEEEEEEEEDDGNKGKGDVVAELEEGEIEREEMFMDSDDEEVVAAKGPIKSKHEIEDLPPVPPVVASLEPHHKTMPVGIISSILGNKVIVEGSETHNPLNEGSILWITETRSPLGIIDEIFGPVKNPYYVIRFNSEEEFPKGISVGAAVSFTSEFAEHILNQNDLYKKGYDASGDHDEEIEDEIEFSDDEKEAEYRRSLRQQKRGTTHVDHASGFGKKTNFKGAGYRKDKQPPMSLPPLAAAACQQFGSQAGQLQAQATNIRWTPGTANQRPNVGPPTMMMQTCPSQPQALQMGAGNGIGDPSQQLNAVWPHGFPPGMQSMGIQEGSFPMNSLSVQQLGQQNYAPQYQFQFNQALNMFASGLMPYLQQQFRPNVGVPQGNMPWFGGPANPLAGPPLPPVVTMGQGGFGQAPLGCSNVNYEGTLASFSEQSHGQAPPAFSQGEVRPPLVHSNRGRTFFRGRGRHSYSGRGRHSFGGRGQQKNG